MNLISRLRHALLGDPIRIARDEGRLLRLQVGQRVILDDALSVVAERDESRDAQKPGVRYRLVAYDEAVRTDCLPDAPCVIDSRMLATQYDVNLERDSNGSSLWLDFRLANPTAG